MEKVQKPKDQLLKEKEREKETEILSAPGFKSPLKSPRDNKAKPGRKGQTKKEREEILHRKKWILLKEYLAFCSNIQFMHFTI